MCKRGNVMYREKVLKSQLLKNVPIELINRYKGEGLKEQTESISVYERDGQYYVIDGLDSLLQMNGTGDALIDCYVSHKNSFL